MKKFERVIAGGGLPAAHAIKSSVSPLIADRSFRRRRRTTLYHRPALTAPLGADGRGLRDSHTEMSGRFSNGTRPHHGVRG